MIRRLLSAILAAVAISGPANAADDIRMQAPSGLVISYSADAANRPALREAMLHDTAARLDGLQKSGVITHYRLLWSRYADNLNWDAMLILDFRPGANIAGWAKVEAANPGGLSISTARLIKRIESAPIDAPREKYDKALGTPVYLVVPYDYVVSLGDYMKYLDGYVLPQLDGWMSEHALQGYEVAIARYANARPWSSMLLLDYRGDAGLASRDAVLARVRSRLADDPSWKAFADNKQHIRDERAPIVADVLAER